MKVSVNEILGSARRINNRREYEEESPDKKRKGIKSDSITISNRINSRLDKIETELRDIQSSLTKNQIIKDGIGHLRDDLAKGGLNQKKILNEFKFEGKNILRGFVGEPVSKGLLDTKYDRVNEQIKNDISNLKSLQIEVDNIMASNLAGPEKVAGIMSNINLIFSDVETQNLENISSLNADSVRRLIR